MQNPHMPDIPMNRDVTYFARTNFRGGNQIFGIKRKDRRQHMYVLGKSGTGKSALLSNLIIQNVWNGEGVCVVDPHGELVETVLKMIPEHRLNDVVYFNPADTEYCIGFNPLELPDPKYKHLVASGLMGIFTKIWANVWSSRMEYIMNNTILALLDTPNSTLLGIPRMLVDKDYRQVIIENLKDPIVKAFWVHEYEQWKEQFRNEAIAPIQNKVGQFLSSSIIRNIVGQQESTIDIFKMMNEGKIFLVNVSKGRIGEDNSALLGAMIITKLQLAAMERVRIPEDERRDFYLYVDEFQNFVTDSFASILSEARKYRLCLILAHQYTAQIEGGDNDLKDAVFGNVGSMVIFRIGSEDAKLFEKEFAPEFIPEDFVGLPNYQVFLKLMIDGVTSRPFSANTLPPIRTNISFDSSARAIQESRNTYCRPQIQVENNINAWSSTSGGTTVEAKSNPVTGGKMYPAVCVNCNKDIMVPFEPKDGKPIYCKECLNKIKVGELKPNKGYYDKNSNSGPKPAESLAMLGIEYDDSIINSNNRNNKSTNFVRTGNSSSMANNTEPTKKSFAPKKEPEDSYKEKLLKEDPAKKQDGFGSLKDLLNKVAPTNKIPQEKPVSNNTPIQNDPKKITLHSHTIKKENNFPETNPILKTKAASYESQQMLKNLIETTKQTVNNSPVVSTPIQKTEEKEIVATKEPEAKIENKKIVEPVFEVTERKIEHIVEDKPENAAVPKPPESYSKRTPTKEVPEDILKQVLNDEEKPASTNTNVNSNPNIDQ